MIRVNSRSIPDERNEVLTPGGAEALKDLLTELANLLGSTADEDTLALAGNLTVTGTSTLTGAVGITGALTGAGATSLSNGVFLVPAAQGTNYSLKIADTVTSATVTSIFDIDRGTSTNVFDLNAITATYLFKVDSSAGGIATHTGYTVGTYGTGKISVNIGGTAFYVPLIAA